MTDRRLGDPDSNEMGFEAIGRSTMSNNKKSTIAGLINATLALQAPSPRLPTAKDKGVLQDLRFRQRELGRAKREVQEAQQKLNSIKMESVRRLTSGVAHVFNNLLTPIKGYSELLLKWAGPADPLRRCAEQISKAADCAASVICQLQAFAGRQMRVPKLLDLNAVLADMTPRLRQLIGEQVELITLWGLELRRVKADPAQIEQVMMNLVLNARDAMPHSGQLTTETANIELHETDIDPRVRARPGAYVMLAVTDTGCGMDRETQSHLFEPFFTTKDQSKGMGLGLSTLYGIVKQNEGYVVVTSRPGQGARFKIYLPAVQENIRELNPVKVCAGPYPGAEVILLVEDQELVRHFVGELLRSWGYTVLEASNGNEALSTSKRQKGPIGLMVTDVEMPEMSGRELASHLSPLRPEMKVLFMSGYTMETFDQDGMSQAGTEFLQKPFTAAALRSKLKDLLGAGLPSG